MSYTKADIVKTLCQEVGFIEKEASGIVNDFFESIVSCLESGDNVKISGFGNFSLKKKQERPGRNPKTGDVVIIKPRTVVTFKPGQKLKKRVESCIKN